MSVEVPLIAAGGACSLVWITPRPPAAAALLSTPARVWVVPSSSKRTWSPPGLTKYITEPGPNWLFSVVNTSGERSLSAMKLPAMATAPPVLPRPMRPLRRVVAPVWVFGSEPRKVSVPAPTLVRAKARVPPSRKIPVNTLSALLLTVRVSVPAVAEPLSTMGEPMNGNPLLNAETVSGLPFRRSVAELPVGKDKAGAEPNAVALPSVRVPALSVVVPVKLLAVLSVRADDPDLTKPVVPLIEPEPAKV